MDLFRGSESAAVTGSNASNAASFLSLFIGYVLGLIMMVIIIAIGAGIVVGYIYKRSVATLLCPKAVLGIKSWLYKSGISECLQTQPDANEKTNRCVSLQTSQTVQELILSQQEKNNLRINPTLLYFIRLYGILSHLKFQTALFLFVCFEMWMRVI